MDPKELLSDLAAGRAKITWAVFQFNDDPKLIRLQEDKNFSEFLGSLEDSDPYGIRQLPAINGVKQYLIMGKENKLPFNEEGLTKKQGEDEMARAVAREQLAIYAEKFPWTEPMIQAGLERAEKADCHSCVEARLVGEVAQAVKARLDKEQWEGPAVPKQMSKADARAARPGYIMPGDEPSMWGAREPCPLCTLKHLTQAIVLLNESLTGYPTHRWYAIGHIAEAEAEAPTLDMANRIRVQRLNAMDDLDKIPDFTEIVEELDAIVRG